MARTSAMAYKHTNKTISQIGRELGVDYILEGSVRREGGDARVSAQLIRVSDQTHLWAQNYQRELHDLLQIENELGTAIARQVQAMWQKDLELIFGTSKRPRDQSPGNVASLYALAGDKDSAFKWLDKAYVERDGEDITLLKVDPAFKNLRSDPRFAALLRRMGLPE